MKYMINRYLHAFSCNFGYNCTRKWLNCTRLRLVKLPRHSLVQLYPNYTQKHVANYLYKSYTLTYFLDTFHCVTFDSYPYRNDKVVTRLWSPCNLVTTLLQPCHNLVTTLSQPCSIFTIPLQPCKPNCLILHKVATTLSQPCDNLVTTL